VKKLLVVGVAAFVLAVSSRANAYVVTYSPGLNGPLGNQVTFDGLPALSPPAVGPGNGNFTSNGVTFQGTGLVVNGTNPNFYAAPAGDNSNYMAVLGGRSETLSYASLMSEFGLFWGSIDSFNHLTFLNTNDPGFSLTISGSDLPAPPPIPFGDQANSASNQYVTITGLPAFNEVVFTSDQNAFEFDNVAAAVPEPSTWAMMILGFLGLGYLTWRRKASLPLAAAA
jgi:hypothetical protein